MKLPLLLAAGLAALFAGAASAAPAAQSMRREELRIDVTGQAAIPGKLEIAATAYLPDPARLTDRPVAIFALPGGGTNRHYYDIHLPGHEGYSEAEHHVARGFILIAIDHLGVGDSTKRALDTMRIEDIAQADDAAVREIARRLMQGTLAAGYPPLPNLFKVGIGHSMGGGITIIMQGRYQTYDAIAPHGYSAIHTVLPQPTEAARLRGMQGPNRRASRWTDPATLSLAQSSKSTSDYIYPFFWEDVPQDIIEADLGGGSPGQHAAGRPTAIWTDRSIPNCVIAMLSPGYVAEEAAMISVPVLIMLGERDVVPTPLAEPAAYQSATDISVVIVPHLAHNHNLGSARQIVWDRLTDWARSVSRRSVLAAAAASDPPPRQVELRIDITGKVNLPGKIQMAATAYLPDVKRLGDTPIVMFALPGGGLTRRYFDLRLPNHEGYSEAAHHAARAIILVAIDHLGVGDSTLTALNSMHIEDIAQADDAAVREITARLRQGTLAPDFPALPRLFTIGVGQSMGGGLTILMQGRYRTYQAIAPLGYSAIHTVTPQPTEADRKRVQDFPSYHNGRWVDPQTLSLAESAKANSDYEYFQFWDDVPEDIKRMRREARNGGPTPDWMSKTIPSCVIGMLSPGYVATEAAEISVPVFIGLGERDVVPNPLAEPAAYQSTRDITVFVVPRLAHTHNFGGTRQVLWDRLVDWARTVSQDRPPQ